MRIAILSVHSCPLGRLGSRDTGGMSVYIRETASELGKRGHLVDIYTCAHDSCDEIVELAPNTRLIHMRVDSIEPLHKLVLYARLDDVACSIENYRRRNGLEYDIVHSHYWLSCWVGRVLTGWSHVPHIAMFHTLAAAKNATGIGDEEPELRLVTERELVQDCDRIIALTVQEKEALTSYCGVSPQKISVIPAGVNLSLFRNIDREFARRRLGLDGGKIALCVGRLEPLKGLESLLLAFSSLDCGNEVRLIIVGEDGDENLHMQRLQSLATDLGVDHSVFFAGAIDQTELPFYYNAADICVIPSYYESFSLVALEALACGTPVVSTDVGTVRSVVRQDETGIIVEGHGPEALAEGMKRILAKQKVRTSEEARDSVSHLSWSRIAEMLIAEYERTR